MIRIMSFVFCVLISLPAGAQERFPARAYSPDELISFTRETPIKMALQILNTYAQRYENRIIIDKKERNRPIGVDVEKMHWKRAFEYILRSNMLKYETHEKYYEILELGEQEKEPEEEGVTFETREVEIKAVFFQADYETLFELGIDWSTFHNGKVEVRTLGATSVAQEFFRISGRETINGKVRVDALLRAFESRSKGEVIARPQIRVIDGEEGKIKVGKNFFLTIQDFAGNTRYAEYEAGVILTVKPQILGNGDSTFIYLEIKAERSDVRPDDIGVTKDITEGHTRVMLLNGEETVIAGLLSHEKKSVHKGVPILKDLPWWFLGLRYLFGFESNSVTKKELVIFIRAYVVPELYSRRRTRVNIRDFFNSGKYELNQQLNPSRRRSNARRSSSSRSSSRK